MRIVTPEAVELDLDAAGMASRFLAALLDALTLMVVLWALLTVASLLAATAPATDDGAAIVSAVIVSFGLLGLLVAWPITWEIATKGRSVGKLALGLRVVTVDGAPIKARHAVVRGFVGLVEIVLTLGMVAVTVALGSARFRRLGDHLAGTVVVRERGAGADQAHPRRFQPLPGWEAWATRLDVSRLSPDDYRLVRSFLVRSGGLPAEARDRLGGRILTRVLPRAGIDVTDRDLLGGWPVEAPLLAVAAAYQRRFD